MNVVTTQSRATVQFRACRPVPWDGRYARLMGDGAVFHLRYVNGRLWPVLLWKTDEGVATCPAVNCAATVKLVEAVSQAKRHAGGEGGGSFLINEYGQVLVPATEGGGRRFLVGRLKGTILFENLLVPGETIDLGDAELLENGDPWELPYVGIPYHLHRRGNIYFYRHDESGGRTMYPPRQDHELIRAIRNVRPYGPVRILVNPAGLVLTKVPSGAHPQSEDDWQPVFVGSINPNLWFEEE
jgi:hypothetical protein